MKKQLLALALVAALALAGSSWAASNQKPPIITTYAAAGSDLLSMTISGVSFAGASGSHTTVTLGSYAIPLTITSMTNSSITVLLPAGIEPGSYLLTIATSNPAQADEG
jgi:hypothetical protein